MAHTLAVAPMADVAAGALSLSVPFPYLFGAPPGAKFKRLEQISGYSASRRETV